MVNYSPRIVCPDSVLELQKTCSCIKRLFLIIRSRITARLHYITAINLLSSFCVSFFSFLFPPSPPSPSFLNPPPSSDLKTRVTPQKKEGISLKNGAQKLVSLICNILRTDSLHNKNQNSKSKGIMFNIMLCQLYVLRSNFWNVTNANLPGKY